ncbi:MAG TPA: amidohydrolase family protein [Chloroflexota bacterium]|nr:amidohydrolase family protein [Chloroflexota bacterium]
MGVIDADTHVDETEATWEFMDANDAAFKPQPAAPRVLDPSRPPTRYWMIDGHRQPRLHRDDQRTHTTVDTRELLDPMARVRHMDELGTEVQVIYPTTFLVGVTDSSAVEVAIKRSYNRWLADRCEQTGGRLRWVCLPPFHDIPKAIEELRFAKAHGACGILKKGDREAGHWVNEEYFFPIYEECERLDMPVCFHIGSGTPDFSSGIEFASKRFLSQSLPPIHAFNSLVTFGIPTRFPSVRWGFIETGASWVPHMVYQALRRLRRLRHEEGARVYTYEKPSDVVRLNKFYITCQVDEDLPYILQYTGEESLMAGSDYTHADASQEFGFVRILQERADRGEIPHSAVRRITEDNPRAFYGL